MSLRPWNALPDVVKVHLAGYMPQARYSVFLAVPAVPLPFGVPLLGTLQTPATQPCFRCPHRPMAFRSHVFSKVTCQPLFGLTEPWANRRQRRMAAVSETPRPSAAHLESSTPRTGGPREGNLLLHQATTCTREHY